MFEKNMYIGIGTVCVRNFRLLNFKLIIYMSTNFILLQANLARFKLSFDKAATYVFPMLFICFNVCYWTVYLIIMPYFIEDRDRK